MKKRISYFGVGLTSNNISTAWNKDRFVIYVKTKENVGCLRLLWQAIQNKDIACWAGQDLTNPYSRPHLFLAIVSQLSDETKKIFEEYDDKNSSPVI